MSVFNRLVLRNNVARSTSRSTADIMYRSNNPLRRVQRRLFSGEWTHQPLPPDAGWLERWALKNELDWIVMLGGDFMLNAIWWSFFIYRWCIESDAHKIDWHNNFEPPPIVPGGSNYINWLGYQWTPLQWKYTHNQKYNPTDRPYFCDGFQIDDPANRKRGWC